MIGAKHEGIEVEQLNALGNAWTKREGETRWYVNDWQEMIGMEVVYYNTGNVSDVYYHGGPDSHGEGHPSNYWYKKNVAGTKVWIDSDGAVHVDYCTDAGVEKDIVAKLEERIEAVMAPATESAEAVFAAEPETEEAGEDVEKTIEVLVVRKADGKAAKVLVPDTGEDLWYSIDRAYPRSYDLMDESMVTPSEHIEGWDEKFGPGEDPELAAWLQECEAVAVELDELGRVTGAIAGFEGAREWAVRKAVEAAQEFIENSGVDTSELRVEVRIGDEAVWAFDDSEGSE